MRVVVVVLLFKQMMVMVISHSLVVLKTGYICFLKPNFPFWKRKGSA